MRTSLSRGATAALILLGLTGCQTGSGYSFWKGSSSTTAPATATASTPATPASQPTSGPPAGRRLCRGRHAFLRGPRQRQPVLSDTRQPRRPATPPTPSYVRIHPRRRPRIQATQASPYASTPNPYAAAPLSAPARQLRDQPLQRQRLLGGSWPAPAAGSSYPASHSGRLRRRKHRQPSLADAVQHRHGGVLRRNPFVVQRANLQLRHAQTPLQLHHAKPRATARRPELQHAGFERTAPPTPSYSTPASTTTRRLRATTRRPCRVRRRRRMRLPAMGHPRTAVPPAGQAAPARTAMAAPANGSYSTGSAPGAYANPAPSSAANRQRLLRSLRHERGRLEFGTGTSAPTAGPRRRRQAVRRIPAIRRPAIRRPAARRRRRALIPPAAIPTRRRPAPRRREAMRRICPAARAASRPICRGLPPPHVRLDVGGRFCRPGDGRRRACRLLAARRRQPVLTPRLA